MQVKACFRLAISMQNNLLHKRAHEVSIELPTVLALRAVSIRASKGWALGCTTGINAGSANYLGGEIFVVLCVIGQSELPDANSRV